MKKLIYIIFFWCFTAVVLHATSGLIFDTRTNPEVFTSNEKYARYKLTSFDKIIYISQIEKGSYVMIFDSSGRNVYKQIADNQSLSIPIYSKGVYIVRIQKNKDIFTERIWVK